MEDLKFALWSKYTILGIILFAVLFSLRGSCDRETGECEGGFPFKWLFRDSQGVYVSWAMLGANMIAYYALAGSLLFAMRKYADHKDKKAK
jgi:hypothetical protein